MADVLNETVEDAMKNVNEACGEALESGKWMTVTWFVKDGKLMMRRTTWNFPTGDFEKCIEQLQNVCNTQTGKSRPDKGPLPFADILAGKRTPMSVVDKVAEESSIPPAKEPTFEEIVESAKTDPPPGNVVVEKVGVDSKEFDKATEEMFSKGLEKKVEKLDKEIVDRECDETVAKTPPDDTEETKPPCED
ncbi:hypothetical protein LCGC14_0249160 [marine sediment metagenome]|uniref:Uncharacterized protein n=1 Tax=marine sediment metagenome TaxID=412755 RepID=A0A0F9X9S3_9ZZZZ